MEVTNISLNEKAVDKYCLKDKSKKEICKKMAFDLRSMLNNQNSVRADLQCSYFQINLSAALIFEKLNSIFGYNLKTSLIHYFDDNKKMLADELIMKKLDEQLQIIKVSTYSFYVIQIDLPKHVNNHFINNVDKIVYIYEPHMPKKDISGNYPVSYNYLNLSEIIYKKNGYIIGKLPDHVLRQEQLPLCYLYVIHFVLSQIISNMFSTNLDKKQIFPSVPVSKLQKLEEVLRTIINEDAAIKYIINTIRANKRILDTLTIKQDSDDFKIIYFMRILLKFCHEYNIINSLDYYLLTNNTYKVHSLSNEKTIIENAITKISSSEILNLVGDKITSLYDHDFELFCELDNQKIIIELFHDYLINTHTNGNKNKLIVELELLRHFVMMDMHSNYPIIELLNRLDENLNKLEIVAVIEKFVINNDKRSILFGFVYDNLDVFVIRYNLLDKVCSKDYVSLSDVVKLIKYNKMDKAKQLINELKISTNSSDINNLLINDTELLIKTIIDNKNGIKLNIGRVELLAKDINKQILILIINNNVLDEFNINNVRHMIADGVSKDIILATIDNNKFNGTLSFDNIAYTLFEKIKDKDIVRAIINKNQINLSDKDLSELSTIGLDAEIMLLLKNKITKQIL